MNRNKWRIFVSRFSPPFEGATVGGVEFDEAQHRALWTTFGDRRIQSRSEHYDAVRRMDVGDIREFDNRKDAIAFRISLDNALRKTANRACMIKAKHGYKVSVVVATLDNDIERFLRRMLPCDVRNIKKQSAKRDYRWHSVRRTAHQIGVISETTGFGVERATRWEIR